MDGQNHLGIYLAKGAATVVCLNLQARGRKLVDCFSVSAVDADCPALASLIAQTCAAKQLEFSEVAIALDCAMFMQHAVRSEFNDPKQIAATVRFDTEEALAVDIGEVAIGFKVVSSSQSGSDVSVFTVPKKVLAEIINSLQGSNIDPATIEPDVNCLCRFVMQDALPSGAGCLCGILSARNGYFIVFGRSQISPAVRTLLVSPAQNRGQLLAREIPVCSELLGAGEVVERMEVFDSAGSVDCQRLGEALGIQIKLLELLGPVGADIGALHDVDPVGFAIAYGAALAHTDRAQIVNFRGDFMPYQGRKMRLQKALRLTSYSVTVFVVAIGLFVQSKLLQQNSCRDKLYRKFARDYSAVVREPAPSGTIKAGLDKLGSLKRRIENVKKGLLAAADEQSITAKLTLVLKTFNGCAKETDLNVESISITANMISVSGDTASRDNTLRLFGVMKKGGLDVLQQRLGSEGGRDTFSISVALSK